MEQVSKHALSSPDNLANTALMVVLSIRQKWSLVGKQLQDVKVNGSESIYLFSHKKACYEYLQANKAQLYSDTLKHIDDSEQLLAIWLKVPMLGLVKAGFVVQLATGQVGCIDSHNIKLYGVPQSTLTFNKKLKAPSVAKKIKGYIKACEMVGGSLSLWTKWCELMATKYPNDFTSGQHVSMLHIQYLKG